MTSVKIQLRCYRCKKEAPVNYLQLCAACMVWAMETEAVTEQIQQREKSRWWLTDCGQIVGKSTQQGDLVGQRIVCRYCDVRPVRSPTHNHVPRVVREVLPDQIVVEVEIS